MEKEFIPYELALELKELGFNEECFGWYSPVMNGLLIYCNSTNDGTEEKYCTAPLWQQGINFLLNKLNGHYCITFYKDETGYITDNRVDYLEYDFENFTECLKKLINIIK